MDQTARPRKRNTSNEFHWNSRESWLTPTRHELSNEITLDARWIASRRGRGERALRYRFLSREKSRNPSSGGNSSIIVRRRRGDNRRQSRRLSLSLSPGVARVQESVPNEKQRGERWRGNRKWIRLESGNIRTNSYPIERYWIRIRVCLDRRFVMEISFHVFLDFIVFLFWKV